MDVETTSERIKCNKKVSDIATFLQEWTRERKSYNTFKSNCQTFCIALYEYLVKEYYPEKIKQLCQYLQSPFDQSQFSNHLKTSKKNNDNDNDNDLHVSQHVKKKILNQMMNLIKMLIKIFIVIIKIIIMTIMDIQNINMHNQCQVGT